MRTSSLLALLVPLLLPATAAADTPVRFPGNLGLGVSAGVWVNGASVKYFINEANALEGVVGLWGLGRASTGFGVSADYLREFPSLLEDSAYEVGWCAGGGPSMAGGGGAFAVGVHATAGIELNLEEFPLDVVLELKPGVLLLNDVVVESLDLGVMARIYPF